MTPKAIRHYHKLGLLREAERSEAGYRLYGAEDLLRLRRVRKLQDLGLSLRRIGEVLGEPGGEEPLRRVLEALHSEVSREIEDLQERKRRIEGLMARDDLDGAEPPDPSPTFERVSEIVGDRLAGVSPETLEQDRRIMATLDSFRWPEDPAGGYEAVARHFVEHPETYERLAGIGERLAALSNAPEDAPEVERLAEDAVCFFEEDPLPPELLESPTWADGPLGSVFSEVMLSEFSPAQRRWFSLVRERLGERGGEA